MREQRHPHQRSTLGGLAWSWPYIWMWSWCRTCPSGTQTITPSHHSLPCWEASICWKPSHLWSSIFTLLWLPTYLPTYKNDRQFDSGYLFSHQYTFNNFCSKIFHHLRCRYNEKKDTHNLFGTDNFLIYILWTQQTILINNISPVCSWTGDNSITKCGQ